MNTRIIVTAALAFVFAIAITPSNLGAQQQTSNQPNAQQQQSPPHYRVFQLGSLGGSVSTGNTINNLGWAMGTSNLTGNASEHATLWAFGFGFDLGTLGGPNSNIGWPVRNDRGVIAGVSEFSNTPDPNGEKFSCPVLLPDTGLSCAGFKWENGHMMAIGVLNAPPPRLPMLIGLPFCQSNACSALSAPMATIWPRSLIAVAALSGSGGSGGSC